MALIAAALAVTLRQRAACVDDAYVSFVFARNFAEGFGFVFNIGERIEGYSNFSWVLILAGLNRFFHASIPASAQFIGVFLGAINVWLTLGIARIILGDENRRWAIAAAALTALDLRIAIWNVEGLETPLYLFWILLALRIYLSKRFYWACAAACLGAALTRPDGILIFVSIAAHRIYTLAREKRFPDKYDAASAAIFILPFVCYNVWRMSYFGAGIHPNTFYARGDAGPLVGFLYIVFESYRAWGPLAIIMAAAAVYGAVKAHPLISPLSTWAVVSIISTAALGGDWMPNARFLVPILPAVYIMAAAGCMSVKQKRIGAAILGLLIFTQIAGAALYESKPSFDKRWARNQNEFYMPLAEKLESLGARGKLAAFSDVGYVSYYGGVRVIDTLGLVDKRLARMPAGPQWNTDLDYVLNRRPDFVVNMIRRYGKFEIGHTAFDRASSASARFRGEYELIDSFPGYEASELSWDDFKRHDYTVEFRVWRPIGEKEIDRGK